MKKISSSFLLLFFCSLAFGQANKLNIKVLQRSLAKVSDNLYASKFETTNEQYAIFLKDLKNSQQSDKIEIAKIDTAKWSDTTIFRYTKPYSTYYHAHIAYSNFPVVNISYEGATLFCDWLSDQYNTNKKRKFQKVKFRLPTEEEWEAAAKAGNPTAIYPWEGDEMKNKKGVYHCNYRESQIDITKTKGALLSASVNSYSPNKYGLYNMSGNVAEMTAEKGLTKGGCWQDSSANVRIDGKGVYAHYDSPMPTIGFRVFMEIIEP